MQQEYQGSVVNSINGIDYDEWTRITTFRSGSPKGSFSSNIVDDSQADPYAYFLNSTRDSKFTDALSARGMDLTPMPPDRGHAFTLERKRQLWRGNGSWTTSPYVWTVKGWTYSGSLSAPVSNLDTWAYQQWGRLAPTSVVFDAAQFFGELREGLPSVVPSLLKGKISFFKDLGKDYLNVEFGWKPFLSDLQNAAKALLNAQTALSRPYGPVHRSSTVEYPDTSDYGEGTRNGSILLQDVPTYLTSSEISKAYPGGLLPAGYTSLGLGISTYTTQKNWFEANFFLLPKIGYDPSDFVSRLDSLVNTRITPSVLWELTPWSWLVDWGLRIGDALQTAERLADDRVHAQYAYGMRHTTVRRHAKVIENPRNLNLSSATLLEKKERVRANPYGFKVGGYSGLNAWQQSILLALGLTKTRI